jgi:hypothetical protein
VKGTVAVGVAGVVVGGGGGGGVVVVASLSFCEILATLFITARVTTTKLALL